MEWRKGLTVVTATLALALATVPADAQWLVFRPAWDTVVLTDPLVRTAQLGYTPVGTLTNLDARTGLALVVLPSAGARWVQLLDRPVATGSEFVTTGLDLASGIHLFVRIPATRRQQTVEQLEPATVLRATANGVTVRRRGAPSTDAELLPHESVYVTRNGRSAPIRLLGVRPTRGSSVLIPAASGARGAIRVRPASMRR